MRRPLCLTLSDSRPQLQDTAACIDSIKHKNTRREPPLMHPTAQLSSTKTTT